LPENLTLTSNVVLHKISVVRWEKERVVIHHLGGTDPIYYKYIADPQRGIMLALRDIQMSKPQPRSRAVADAAPVAHDSKFSGECYVAESSTGTGIYKISGVTILVLPPEAAERFADDNSTITLPKPLTQAVTDDQGKFAFTLPLNQDFYLVAQSYRLVAGQKLYFNWHMKGSDFKDPNHIVLNNTNCAYANKKLLFDKDP
jgi:hypothetical protein